MRAISRECVLTWAKEYWPYFDRMPYDFHHFYKIVAKEGLNVVIESELSGDIETDCLRFTCDKRIWINANGQLPEGDSLVFAYAKLFNYYYLSSEGFQNFHSCLNPQTNEYKDLCLTAGFLAVAPSRIVLEDLRNGIDPAKKYQLSAEFAYKRLKLLMNRLIKIKGRDPENELVPRSHVEGIGLCREYLAKLETVLNSAETSA